MERTRFGGLLAAALLIGLGAAARAQQTIDVPITTLLGTTATRGLGQGANVPSVGDIGTPNQRLVGFQPGSYAEFPVSTTTPGMYTVSLKMRMTAAADLHTVMALETRPAPDSLFNTRYGTVDTKDYGVMMEYIESGPLVAADGATQLQVPLMEGQNILRIFHVTGRHNPANSYPTDLSSQTARPTGTPWSNLDVATITMNRVGDLPALGTINGTITGSQPAGIPVTEAIVAANPPGNSPVELSWFWRSGWFTYTRPDGTYTLKAPLGATEVKAGRPSSYEVQGATTTVTVGATAATANITLPSIFFKNAQNEWTAYPQAEYLDRYSGTLGLVPLDGPPENSYKIGWTNAGEWVGLLIDVPEAGNYEVTSAYTNGGSQGVFRVYTSLGPSTQDTQPNSGGWGTLARKTYANPIYLAQGTQMLYQAVVSGESDFDGIHLRRLNTPITMGTVHGKVTNSAAGGGPVAGATVAIGNSSVTTDAEGNYRIVALEGLASITVSHTNQDAPALGTAMVTAGGDVERNFTLSIRPVVPLSTANGYTWKYLANTGGAADYSGVSADESGFATITVPRNIAEIVPTNDIYIWYRLHFTVPEGFLSSIPGRKVRIRIPGVDDVDRTWLNGTLLGQTGSFPEPPLDPQDPSYRNPAPNATTIYYPGLDIAWNQERAYYFDASLLKPGDNVLAIKVFQLSQGGGLTSIPYLEVAPAKGAISGKVLVGGAGQANIRVAAMNTNAVTSDWTWTAADGSFTLANVNPGNTIVSAVKPGIKPITANATVSENSAVTNLTLNTTVEPDGVAAIYDDFNATSAADSKWWTNLWDAIAIEPNQPRESPDPNNPTIYEPGYRATAHPVMPSADTPMPGTITIQSGVGYRGGLLSKARFSKFASVNSGRLVSALPASNVIFRLVGNALADDPLTMNSANYVELDLEGTAGYMGEFGFPEERVRYRLFTSSSGEISLGAVPVDISSLGVLSMTNALELTITRAGSFFDYYINGIRVHSRNLPNALPIDHKIFPYSWHANQVHTWDWVKASPKAYVISVPGDLSGNGVLDMADAAKALRIWGGLDAATPAQVEIGNVAPDPGITILDALKLGRAVNGQPL